MAVITVPDAVAATMGGLSYGQTRYDIMEVSEPTGASAVRVLGPPRWGFALQSKRALTLADGAQWESMLLRLRGSVNHLAVWDFLRPAPLGTMRGEPLLNAALAVGATTLGLKYMRSATNLLYQWTTLEGDKWLPLSGGTVTANVTTAPGSAIVSADQVEDASNTVVRGIEQLVTVPNDAQVYTGSIYVKATTGGTSKTVNCQLQLINGTTVTSSTRFNTDTGAVLSGSGTVTDAGGGWWRVSQTITNNTTGNTTLRFQFQPAIAAHGLSTTDVTQQGNAIVWGPQLELGSVLTDVPGSVGLLVGDWLQVGTGVGSHLCKVVVASNSNSSNQQGVTFEPPTRTTVAIDTAVTWDKPLAYCKLTNTRLNWAARANGPAIDGFAADLLEDWGP